MLPRVRTILLLGLLLLLGLGIDAAAQVGRLAGTVAYATPGRPTAAIGVRVVAVGDYGQWETRTDGNGNFVMALREGRYRVVAQGLPGSTTYGNVWGYVRANMDSIIIPNPLFLVSTRSSSGMPPSTLSQMTTWLERTPTAQQNKLALEMAAPHLAVGRLFGTVMYKDTSKTAKGATVVAITNYGQWETKTDGNGNFGMVLPEGSYRIVAQGSPDSTTLGNVWGYVKANVDSFIIPNPLFLVPLPPPRHSSGR